MNKLYYILILFFTISSSTVFAWGFSNKAPETGIVGLRFGAILPTGGDGQVFVDEDDAPHAEYGIFGGFDYWKRYTRAYDLHLGTLMKYQQYHFHFGEEEFDGYYRFLHVSVPASFHYPIPNYSYMFFKVGVALSSANIIQENIGFAGQDKYITRFKTSWLVYPEVTLGIDLIEEKGERFYFKAGLDYTFLPVPNMAEYETYISNNGVIESGNGSFTANKFQLSISFYPIWKKKISFLKEGHNCPNPF